MEIIFSLYWNIHAYGYKVSKNTPSLNLWNRYENNYRNKSYRMYKSYRDLPENKHIVVVVIVISIPAINNQISQNTKQKFHHHIYTWAMPDDTLLSVDSEAEAHRAGNCENIHRSKSRNIAL